jgi:site-specific DNA-methyltransferase (adenine-specific)
MKPISIAECEDCMEAIRAAPDKFWDLAICDPPFFAGVANGRFYGTGLSGTGRKRGVYKKIDAWDENIPTQEYYDELVRVSKNQIIWGINYFQFIGAPVGRLVWDKKNDESTFSNCEIASCSLIESVKIFRYLWRGFMQEPGNIKQIKIHPTQKPIQLYEWCLTNYAKPGDKILDTHMGSQSSRIAAFKMNFDYWGYEIDRDYFEAGCKRFEQAIAQPLFDQPKVEQGKLI